MARIRGAAAIFISVVLSACDDANPEVGAAVAGDTLPGGAVVVRNGSSGKWERAGIEPWQLAEHVRIGEFEGDSPEVFGTVRNVIPVGDTILWILDSQAQEMRAFHVDGRHLRTIGGPGEGPGEFRAGPCARRGPGDDVWVESGRTWQRFSPEGELIGSQPVTRSLGCGVAAWSGGVFLAAAATYEVETASISSFLLVHQLASDGSVVVTDTVDYPSVPERVSFRWNENGRPRITTAVPLVHQPAASLQNATGDFLVWDGGGAYQYRKQNYSGDTLQVVSRDYTPVPVDARVRQAEIDDVRRDDFGYPDNWDPNLIPDLHPPFHRLIEATDRRVWAQRTLAGSVLGFDVFEADGTFLGTIQGPDPYPALYVHHISDNYLDGVITDELGVQYVVRLAIQR